MNRIAGATSLLSGRRGPALLAGVWLVVVLIWVPLVLGGGSAERAQAEEGPGARPVTITWVGDMTLGSRYGLPPQDGRALLTRMRRGLSRSDLALGNLEGTFGIGGTSKCGTADGGQCFSFQAPPANARALRWAGFDLVNLANNHAWDFGATGQQQTIAALDAGRVAHSGRPGQITTLLRRGVRIAVVGFAPYPWANDPRDLAGVRALVARAEGRADVVVVLAHLGTEGAAATHVPVGPEALGGEDRGDTRAFAHAAVDAGADVVLGSGPHVLRGLERYRGRLIAYSLGNFAGWHNFGTSGVLSESAELTVRIAPDGELRGGRVGSVRLDAAGVPSPDPAGAGARAMDALAADFGAAGVRVGVDGRLALRS